MNFKTGMRINKFPKVVLISILFLGFSYISAFAQTPSAPISFTKKEIAFFKWGKGENEVRLNKHEKGNNARVMGSGGKIYSYSWPRVLHVDGNDNLYFGNANGQIFIVSSDGNLAKKISWEKTGGLWLVDGDGNIYATYNKKDEPEGFILTKPDGSQEVYKNFHLNFEDNGIVYDLTNNKSLTITENGDKPEKRPPHLMSYKEMNDFNKTYQDSFEIYTRKINKHLKKNGRRIDAEKIKIKIEKKKDLTLLADLIGVDDDGYSYFFCGYTPGPGIAAPWEEMNVMVYSQTGQKISEIPMELDCFDKQVDLGEIALDIRGNIFRMWANEDGMHILKWIKN